MLQQQLMVVHLYLHKSLLMLVVELPTYLMSLFLVVEKVEEQFQEGPGHRQPARCVRAERARGLCVRSAPSFMRAAWWVIIHIVSVCFHLSMAPPRPSWPHRKLPRLPRSARRGSRSARGKTQQGGAQKVSPGANVFSWKFCTRTSRSRRLNRYG